MGNKTDSTGDGETTPKLTELIEQLGIAAEDWRQWLRDFEPGAVLAALIQLDLDTLPFMGEGS